MIHSGSFYEHGVLKASTYGIVMGIEGPQIECGRRRSILVHWGPGYANPILSWVAPRDVYLVDEALGFAQVDFRVPDEYNTMDSGDASQ